ncbi:hypothetical protein FACS189459_4090 [Bacilli bacterium]|nr:hypothetical protein FACS189459_4090 [Bacilli bacterium]
MQKVSEVFNNKTPCLAQSDKSPLFLSILKSFFNSLKMLFKEGGNLLFLSTLNANPLASPFLGYGS